MSKTCLSCRLAIAVPVCKLWRYEASCSTFWVSYTIFVLGFFLLRNTSVLMMLSMRAARRLSTPAAKKFSDVLLRWTSNLSLNTRKSQRLISSLSSLNVPFPESSILPYTADIVGANSSYTRARMMIPLSVCE